MWITGHTAFAYLLIWVFYVVRRKRIQPSLLLFIFIFANLPDALHAGFLRALSHNPIGTFLFAAFWMLFFNRFGLIEKKHFPVLLLVTGTHVLSDFLFSGYKFLYPFANTEFQVFAFNSFEDLLAESVLVIVFALVMFLAGDVRRMRSFLQREKDELHSRFSLKSAFSTDFLPFYLFVAFFTVSVLQFLFYVYLSWHSLLAFVWYKWLFLAVFLLYLIVLTVMGFGTKLRFLYNPLPHFSREGV